MLLQYSGIFSLILTFGSQIWIQIKKISILIMVTVQYKAVNTLNFANSASSLFKGTNISDNIHLLV